MATYMATLATAPSVSTTPFFGITAGTTVGWIARVVEVGFSGESASSVVMRTQFNRPTTAGTGTVTATSTSVASFGTLADKANNTVAATSFGTTQWVLTTAGGSLLPFLSWNSYGGIVRWVASLPDEEIILVSLATLTASSQVCISAAVGTGQSSYGIGWKEA
jgi:hypothetical protein